MKSLDLGKELDQEIPGTDTARRKLPELVVVVVMVRGRGVKRRHSLTVVFIIVGGEGRVDFVHHHF